MSIDKMMKELNETSESTKKAAKDYLDKKGYSNYLHDDYDKNKLAKKIAGLDGLTKEKILDAFDIEGIKVSKIRESKREPGSFQVIISPKEDLEKATKVGKKLGVTVMRPL